MIDVQFESKLETTLAKNGAFVIAEDVNDKGAKHFSSFGDIQDFHEWYNSLNTHKYVYEVIETNKPSKLYIDLDINNVTLQSAQLLLSQFIKEVQNFTYLYCHTKCEPVISESHSEKKKSYHVVFNSIILENQEQRQLFCNEFSEYLSEELIEYFDKSVYTKNRCFRLLGSSKYGQNRPLVPSLNTTENIKQHIVSNEFPDTTYKLKFDKIETNDTNVITKSSDNICKLLDSIDIEYWENRTSWLQIASAMKNVGCFYDDFDKYSQKCKNYGGTLQVWNSIRSSHSNKCGMGTLFHYASKSATFDKLSISSLSETESSCIKNIIEKNTLTHYTCCKLFHGHYTDKFIYSNNTWYQNTKSGRYEVIENDAETILGAQISKYFEFFEKNIINQIQSESDRKTLLKLKIQTEKHEFKTSIIKELKQFYNDTELLEKLDSKTHLIGFNNGIFDLRKKEFRKATIEDCVSYTVGYDYNPNVDTNKIEYLENFIYSLFLTKDTGRYFLKHLGSLLHGINREELIHFWVGNGRNGKGTIDDILHNTLGPYYTILEDSFYTNSKKNHNEASPALVVLKNRRIAMTTEPEGSVPYLSSNFKRISGNDPITCRSLYSPKIQVFNPTFKPIIQTNHLPKFTDVDMGLLQRIRVINFCFTFVKPTEYDASNKYHKKIDCNLKTNLRSMRPEFMSLLIKWYYIYAEETLDYPSDDILEVTNSYREDIDSVQTFINSTTIIQIGHNIPSSELLYNYNGWSKDKLSRQVFIQRLKGSYSLKLAKHEGRMVQCLIDRKWRENFF